MKPLENTVLVLFIAFLCTGYCMAADAGDDACDNYCQNAGNCTVVNGTANCACPDEVTGAQCETVIETDCSSFDTDKTGCCENDCAFFNCSKDVTKCVLAEETPKEAECKDTANSCLPDKPDGCSTIKCEHGECLYKDKNNSTLVMCVCKEGYTGDKCETEIPDGCTNLNCEQGGKCVYLSKNNFSEVMCNCEEGYKGETCADKIEVPHPSSKDANKGGQSFDAASFIGGIVLAVGLIIIGVVGFKFYRRKKDPTSRYSQF